MYDETLNEIDRGGLPSEAELSEKAIKFLAFMRACEAIQFQPSVKQLARIVERLGLSMKECRAISLIGRGELKS